MIRAILSILCCLALAGCDAAYNTPGIGPNLRVVVNPGSIKQSIVRVPISLDTLNAECTFSFNLKYTGSYAMVIVPGHNDRDRLPLRTFSEHNSTPLRLKIELLQEDHPPLRYNVGDAEFSPQDVNFAFVFFRCPEDLSRTRPITATIRVVEPDPKMQEAHGPFEVIVADWTSL